jgi:DNA-binding HxlR family transcriptional regulator
MTRSATDRFPVSSHCPHFQTVVELVGKRWTGAILRSLFAGCSRFGEIVEAIPGLSHRLLTERLAELQQAGLVRASEDRRPLYGLTDKGRDLRRVLAEFEAWNTRWSRPLPASPEITEDRGPRA